VTRRPAHVNDNNNDEDDDDGGGLGFTLDFNLGTINRRRERQTQLVASTLSLRKTLTHADNGKPLVKKTLRTCGHFSKTVGNFSTKFYVPITRSYLR